MNKECKMTVGKMFFAGLVCLFGSFIVMADELVLADKGKSEHQIVMPDNIPAPEVGEWLEQAALLVQSAFKANGFNLPIVKEGAKDPAKPAIYLGDLFFGE